MRPKAPRAPAASSIRPPTTSQALATEPTGDRRRSESPKPLKNEERREIVRAIENAVFIMNRGRLDALELPAVDAGVREALESWLKLSKEKIREESGKRERRQ